MSTTIEDRIILLLKEQLTPFHPLERSSIESVGAGLFKVTPRQYAGHGFWEKIADKTGVPSQRWRSVFTRRQKPTPAMIESLAKLWPQYAFWLVTGITDAINGHIAPVTVLSFPERLHLGDPLAESYFEQSIRLNDQLLPAGGINIENDEERLEAVEREWEARRWREGPLLRTACSLHGSTEYGELIDTWAEREWRRASRVSEISHHSDLRGKNIPSTAGGKKSTDAKKRVDNDRFGLFYRRRENVGDRE